MQKQQNNNSNYNNRSSSHSLLSVPCVRHSYKLFTSSTLFNSQNNPMRCTFCHSHFMEKEAEVRRYCLVYARLLSSRVVTLRQKVWPDSLSPSPFPPSYFMEHILRTEETSDMAVALIQWPPTAHCHVYSHPFLLPLGLGRGRGSHPLEVYLAQTPSATRYLCQDTPATSPHSWVPKLLAREEPHLLATSPRSSLASGR